MIRNVIIALALTLSGCAGTTVRQINYSSGGSGYAENEAKGIRYYEGAWFIVVYSDGKGGLKSEALFLPDLRRKLAIDPFSVLAKNETTLTFSNGMLDQSKSVVDESIIPKTALAALEKVALSQIAAANQIEAGRGPYLPLPRIYRVVVADIDKPTPTAGLTPTAGPTPTTLPMPTDGTTATAGTTATTATAGATTTVAPTKIAGLMLLEGKTEVIGEGAQQFIQVTPQAAE